MATLEYILETCKLDGTQKPPIDIPISRWKGLANLFAGLKFNKGAEIGVEKGYFSEALCQANPNLQLSCIDAWKTYSGWHDYVSQLKLNEVYREAKQRLSAYNCKIYRGFSMDIVKKFKDESLDFVYIDAAHDFQSLVNDICEWTKKVRKGGIIAGHDYRRHKGEYICEVVDVVNYYVYAKKIRPWFVVRGDRDPSYLWVKT